MPLNNDYSYIRYMKQLLIYGQRVKPVDTDIVKALMSKLDTTKEIEYYVYTPFADDLSVATSSDSSSWKCIGSKDELIEKGIQLVLTLGGDGTILSATNLVQDLDIPIMGINMGRLGFLANIEKSKALNAIDNIVSGEYYTEERSMLALECNLPLFDDIPFALNDFTLHKRDTSSMITINVELNGEYLNAYWADGLIVSTPTGSTGYSLSCGGPIISPASDNVVITPIAPHNLNVRPIVLSDDTRITLRVTGRSENFLCTLDSRYETITAEHEITLSKCPFKTKLAHLPETDFMKTIRQKLLWGLDKRN